MDESLKRYPVRKGDLLQAWDAADELLLEHAASMDLTRGAPTATVAVLGDAFGALNRGLRERFAEATIVSYTDSYVSARAIELNCGVRSISRLSELPAELDLAILRIPKSMAFLEDQLCVLSTKLKPGATVMLGYMVKHQANAAFELIARIIGPTRTSLAKKKARLIFAECSRGPVTSPYPTQVRLDGFELPFTHHSHLFSRERLDIGTRFFLDELKAADLGSPRDVLDILDLGCGNGIVGVAAQTIWPQARITFADESRLALESATESFARHHSGREAEFVWTHSYETGAPASVDLVLCNPPFHQGMTVGDHVARQMFADAHRVLRPGGTLCVIGNSHLPYPAQLGRLFGEAGIVARNAKFTIVSARKR